MLVKVGYANEWGEKKRAWKKSVGGGGGGNSTREKEKEAGQEKKKKKGGGGEGEREGIKSIIFFKKFYKLFILRVHGLSGAGRLSFVSSHIISSFGFNTTLLHCPLSRIWSVYKFFYLNDILTA